MILNKGAIKNDSLTKYLFTQICGAVDSLHSKAKHAHLDIKLENILISNDYKLKLCDFGFAQDVDSNISTKYGTESYIAPEIEDRKPGDTYKGIQADIFSLGVILFLFKFGAPPFTRASISDPNYKVFSRNNQLFWKSHPSVKKSLANKGLLTEDLVDLLNSMLSSDL